MAGQGLRLGDDPDQGQRKAHLPRATELKSGTDHVFPALRRAGFAFAIIGLFAIVAVLECVHHRQLALRALLGAANRKVTTLRSMGIPDASDREETR